MGLYNISMDCGCCELTISYAILTVTCSNSRIEGNANGPNTWKNLQNSSWLAARDAAYDCMSVKCETPSLNEVEIGLNFLDSYVFYKRHCPASWSNYPPGTEGAIIWDFGLLGNALRWANQIQVGGFSRPAQPCQPPSQPPGMYCNGLFTGSQYRSTIVLISTPITTDSTLESAYGIAKIRYYVRPYQVVQTQTSPDAPSFVEALNHDGYCLGSTPTVPKCHESTFESEPMQSLYGTMASIDGLSVPERARAQWLAVSGPDAVQADSFTIPYNQPNLVMHETTDPCTFTATDSTWFFAVAADPICFDEPGISEEAPHQTVIVPTGCTQGFGAGRVSRQQIAKMGGGHVEKFELLDSAGAIIKTINV